MVAEAVTTAALAGIFYLLLRRSGFAETKTVMPGSTEPAVAAIFDEGEKLLRSQRFEAAEKKFAELARKDPHYPKLHNRLGIIYLERGKYAPAVTEFEEALKEDPGKPVRHANLAMAYKALGKDPQAKRELNKALELDPSNTKYQRLLDELGS